MSTARSLPRSRAWLRALVLLLALLVPVAHAEGRAAAAPALSSGETAEYDIFDTALRPPARAAHRPGVPLRPAPARSPVHAAPRVRPPLAPAPPPYAPPALRSVVLRC